MNISRWIDVLLGPYEEEVKRIGKAHEHYLERHLDSGLIKTVFFTLQPCERRHCRRRIKGWCRRFGKCELLVAIQVLKKNQQVGPVLYFHPATPDTEMEKEILKHVNDDAALPHTTHAPDYRSKRPR